MNKTEIRVLIDSEEKKQRAIEILKKNGEKIWTNPRAMKFSKSNNYLKCSIVDNAWYIGPSCERRIKITLDQLDELLTKQK